MTGNRDKLRSVFLTALMVFSVFAGTVAFTGTAAAAPPDVDQDPVEFTLPDDLGGTTHIEVIFEGDATGNTYELEDRNGDPVAVSVNTTLSNLTAGRVILDVPENLNGEPELFVSEGGTTDDYDVITTASFIEDPGNVNPGTDPDATDGTAEVFKGERFAVANISAVLTDPALATDTEFD
ncbi:MAG: surface glycoprotein, partial [Halobacteriales archaeon]|nr:surface glycoprotein [Halobacteriales archaeon]